MVKRNVSYKSLLTGGGNRYNVNLFGNKQTSGSCIDFSQVSRDVNKIYNEIIKPYTDSNKSSLSVSTGFILDCFKSLGELIKRNSSCQTITNIIVMLQLLLDLVQQKNAQKVQLLNNKKRINLLQKKVSSLETTIEQLQSEGKQLPSIYGEVSMDLAKPMPMLLYIALQDIYTAWYYHIYGQTQIFELDKLCYIREYVDSLKSSCLGALVDNLEMEYSEDLWRFIDPRYKELYDTLKKSA